MKYLLVLTLFCVACGKSSDSPSVPVAPEEEQEPLLQYDCEFSHMTGSVQCPPVGIGAGIGCYDSRREVFSCREINTDLQCEASQKLDGTQQMTDCLDLDWGDL